MRKTKTSNNDLFRVTVEPSHNNRLAWIVYLTFPGQSRYYLRDNEDKIKKFDNKELADRVGHKAFPRLLSAYIRNCADSGIGGQNAIEAAEAMFTTPSKNRRKLSVEHKVNKRS